MWPEGVETFFVILFGWFFEVGAAMFSMMVSLHFDQLFSIYFYWKYSKQGFPLILAVLMLTGVIFSRLSQGSGHIARVISK